MFSASLSRLGAGTLVFVPGILGSGLSAIRLGHNGLPRADPVWGENLTTIMRTLSSDPALLGAASMQVTGVIRRLKLGPFRAADVYGPLIDYCTSQSGLGLALGRNFVPFPYDWRADLRSSADKLDAALDGLSRPVYIVAHSMGGLVTRLMLDRAGAGAKKVEGVFQIASPVGGSSKAFKMLRNKLEIGPMADAIWGFAHGLDLAKQSALTRAISSMVSLYQLLPGDGTPILVLAGGTLVSASDSRAWLPNEHGMLACATAVHTTLKNVPKVPLRCVYSASTQTDWLISVDDNWSMVAVQKTDGDGSVTSASARAHSVDLKPVVGGSTEHTELCSNPQVHDLLREFLSL